MGLSRRQFMFGAGIAGLAVASGLTGCAPGSSSGGGGEGGDPGSAELTMAWWGNDVRNKNTTNAIAAYTKANPGVKISPQPGGVGELLGQAGHPGCRQHRAGHHPDGHGLHRRVRQPRRAARPFRCRHLQVHRGHRRLGQDQRHAERDQRRHQLHGRAGQPEAVREGRHGCAGRQDLDLGLPDRHLRRGGVQGQADLRVPVPGE